MYTLGINAAFHDPSACLVKDGRVVAAAEDERFAHVKRGSSFLSVGWTIAFIIRKL